MHSPLRALCLGLSLLGLATFGTAHAAPPKPAPGWTLTGVDDQRLSLSDYKGKVVVLNFWATWCPPCRAEIPDFIALQKEYGDRGLQFIGVSLDEGGPAVVRNFVKVNGINYPMVMSTPKIAEAYGGIEAIPTTFVIDPQGRIVDKFVGRIEKAKLKKIVHPLLPKN